MKRLFIAWLSPLLLAAACGPYTTDARPTAPANTAFAASASCPPGADATLTQLPVSTATTGDSATGPTAKETPAPTSATGAPGGSPTACPASQATATAEAASAATTTPAASSTSVPTPPSPPQLTPTWTASASPPSGMPSDGNAPGIPPLQGEIHTTSSGLRYIDEKVGNGPSPSGPTATVTVNYTGWLTNGTKFDSSVDRWQPATLVLNQLIRGWTEGVGSMKVGGKRRLIIPASLAYGWPGVPPTIPGNATLIFDIELISIA